MPIGIPPSIGHSCGPQHTTCTCLYSHWDSPFAWGMAVSHVQKQLRYVYINHIVHVTGRAHTHTGNASSPCCPFQVEGTDWMCSVCSSSASSGRGSGGSGMFWSTPNTL